MAITILTFLVCYIPPILHAAWGRSKSDVNWGGRFLVQFSIFLSSGINSVMYCFRNKRFYSAMKQFLKDPCGKRPLQETEPEQSQDTRQVAASHKITDKLKDTSFSPTTRLPLDQGVYNSMAVQDEHGLTKQDCESNRLCRCNKVMAISLQEQEPGRVVKFAWVEHHHTDSQKGKAPEKKVQQPAQITQDKKSLWRRTIGQTHRREKLQRRKSNNTCRLHRTRSHCEKKPSHRLRREKL